MENALALALKETTRILRQSKYQPVDVRKCWETGDLSYKYWPVQKRMREVLWSGGSLKKVLNCSRRIRKTTTMLVESICFGLKKEYAQIRFVTTTAKAMKKIIHPIFRIVTDDCPANLKPEWKGQDGLYLFPSTKAELHIAGVNNGHEDDARGEAADLCVIDEAQLIDNLRYVIGDVLMPQLMDQDKARGPLWMALTPPKTPIHEVMEFVQEAKNEKCYAEFTIDDSEYSETVKEIFAKEVGGKESITWKREYFCQFVIDTNYSIVPEWKDEYIEEYIPDEFYRFYLKFDGMDIGVRDKTVVLFAVYDFKRARLYFQDEFWLSGPEMTTEKVAAGIRKKEKELWQEMKPQVRIADNNNLILLQDLGSIHSLHFAPTNKDTLEAMVNEVRLWVGQGRIRVSPKCEQLIGCLKYGVWDDKRKEWERSNTYGHFDALAALMYLIRNVDANTNPIPKMYGLNEDKQWINEREDLTKMAETLKRALLRK